MPSIETIGLASQFRRHGEAATYVNTATEETRSITVIVDREPPDALDLMPGAPTSRIQVLVRNDATLGIAATELDRGKDRISLAWRIGDAVRTYAIHSVVRQDAATLTLELR